MDLQHQDQTTHTNPSGHESGHVVHLCHRCGWPFPNPHPSAKHRRAHKKICGTIEGYTTLIDSEAVSDDEHNLDDDKEKTPSPKIEKKKSVGYSGGRFSRSEEDLFSDAVTEFSDSGVEDRSSASSKTLDKDLFFSFKDAENGGANEVLDAPVEISKTGANVTVSENVEKTGETEVPIVCDSSEAKLELPDQDGKSSTGLAQEAESINIVKAGEEKVEKTRASETEELINVPEIVTEETKVLKVEASDTTKTIPEFSASVGGYDCNVDREKLEPGTKDEIIEEIEQEKFKSDLENVSEVKESEIVHGVEGISEEIKHEKSELYHEHAPEVAKGSETDLKEVDGVSEVIKHEKIDSDHENVSEVVKKPEVDQSVPILIENEVLGAPESEKCSPEQVQEVFKEPDTVLTELEDLGSPESENCSSAQMQEVVKELESAVTEKNDLDAPKSEECSNKQIQNIVTEPDTDLIEKRSDEHTQEVVKIPDIVLTEKEDLGAPKAEKIAKEHTLKDDNNSEAVADVIVGTITQKEAEQSAKDLDFASDHSNADVKNDSGTGKPMNNQDSVAELSVDSSSHNSLEGNWGSVSVLSTASIDAETVQSIDKPKAGKKPVAADVFEPPSFMTLVEPESKDQKPEGEQEPLPKSEAPQAGWFPTLTNVSNESEGRKRNEEVIAKVTNWSTSGKQHSTPLKSLLGEAKSPNAKQAESVVEKDESATEKGSLPPPEAPSAANQELSSPPKLIEDGKKGKKAKGRGSWMPFVCCSSVNVN